MGPLVNLERARRREVLPAPRAPVLPGLSAWLSRQQRRHARGHGRGSERTRGFDFDVGWLGSDKRRGQTAPAWQAEREKKKKSQTFIIPHSLALQAKKKTTCKPLPRVREAGKGFWETYTLEVLSFDLFTCTENNNETQNTQENVPLWCKCMGNT